MDTRDDRFANSFLVLVQHQRTHEDAAQVMTEEICGLSRWGERLRNDVVNPLKQSRRANDG